MVAAAAGIVTALSSCRRDDAREFLRDALQVVAQLGSSPGEGRPLLHLWTVVLIFRFVGQDSQEQSAAALAVCGGTGGLAGEDLSVGASGSLVSGRVQGAGMSDLSRADQQIQQWLRGRVSRRWARSWGV